MNKKEFYEAPKWALRALMLERTPICASPGSADGDFDPENNLGGLGEGDGDYRKENHENNC